LAAPSELHPWIFNVLAEANRDLSALTSEKSRAPLKYWKTRKAKVLPILKKKRWAENRSWKIIN